MSKRTIELFPNKIPEIIELDTKKPLYQVLKIDGWFTTISIDKNIVLVIDEDEGQSVTMAKNQIASALAHREVRGPAYIMYRPSPASAMSELEGLTDSQLTTWIINCVKTLEERACT